MRTPGRFGVIGALEACPFSRLPGKSLLPFTSQCPFTILRPQQMKRAYRCQLLNVRLSKSLDVGGGKPGSQFSDEYLGIPSTSIANEVLEKNMSPVEEKILAMISKTANSKEVSRSSTWEELGVDSLDIAEFFMEVETQLKVQIPDSEAQNMKNVGEIIDYIEKARKG